MTGGIKVINTGIEYGICDMGYKKGNMAPQDGV
jgi:hypothetical protein